MGVLVLWVVVVVFAVRLGCFGFWLIRWLVAGVVGLICVIGCWERVVFVVCAWFACGSCCRCCLR